MWKYSMLAGWVVMRTRVEIKVSMGRFMLQLTAQKAIRSLVYVQEGKVAVSVVN
jgi:hypothetical protein